MGELLPLRRADDHGVAGPGTSPRRAGSCHTGLDPETHERLRQLVADYAAIQGMAQHPGSTSAELATLVRDTYGRQEQLVGHCDS